MTLSTCLVQHKAIDEKFEDVKIELGKEVIERKQSIMELKEEFKTTNSKIDLAVEEIKSQWFKNLFSLLKWSIISLFALAGFILYHFAVGNLKLHP